MVEMMKRKFVLGMTLCGLLFSGSSGRAQNHEGCLSDAMRSLSFLVGEWQVQSRYRNADGTWEQAVMHSRITSEFAGCALQERFSGSRGGEPFQAIGFLAYDALDDKLQRSWIDDGHGLLVLYKGSRTEDVLELSTRLTLHGEEILFQHVYSDLSQDSFRLQSRRSLDDGETWDTGWYLKYRRVDD